MPTLDVYAAGWLTDRELRPRTRAEYQGLLDRHVLPALGEHARFTVAAAMVRAWHAPARDRGQREGARLQPAENGVGHRHHR